MDDAALARQGIFCVRSAEHSHCAAALDASEAVMALDREKLVRVLGMLGSAHDGERASAGGLAEGMVREAGLTWGEVVFDPEALVALRDLMAQKDDRISHLEEICRVLVAPKRVEGSHRARAAECLNGIGEDYLSGWEVGFLRSFVRGRFNSMTAKQLAILERIEAKLEELV